MVRILRRQNAEENDEGTSYWMSFSDLMAALLAVFVLAVVVLALNLGQQQSSLENQQNQFQNQIEDIRVAEEVRADTVEEIRQTLEDHGVEVYVSENQSVLSIPSEQLGFEAADHEISEDYEDISLTIGHAISDAIRSENRHEHLDTVFVEGHTDDVPHDGLWDTGNWGLSTFRAISLWALWGDELPDQHQLGTLQNASGDPLFSVSGYAETRPVVADQSTETDRAANRRIDVRFTIVRPSAENLEDILEEGGS